MDCNQSGSSVHGFFSGNNTGAGCHFLLQGTFLTRRSNSHLLCWQAEFLPLIHLGKPRSCQCLALKKVPVNALICLSCCIMPNLCLMDLIFWIYHLHIPLSFSFSLIVCSLLTKLHFLSFLYYCPCCSFHLEHSSKLPASSQGWQSSPTYSSKPINSHLLVKLP